MKSHRGLEEVGLSMSYRITKCDSPSPPFSDLLMKQPNVNFSRNPLVLGCYFDPRELFYNAGFDDFGIQWSYDFDSTLKALENFIDGVGTNNEVKFSVTQILAENPTVVIKFDEKSYAKLALESLERKQSPEALLKTLLRVTDLQIVAPQK